MEKITCKYLHSLESLPKYLIGNVFYWYFSFIQAIIKMVVVFTDILLKGSG